MPLNIVTLLVSQQVASAPPTLQRTGAFISQGGTTKAQNSLTLLTQVADLTAILAASLSLTGIVQSAGTATATTAAPHGISTSQLFWTTVAGATGSTTAYNGTVLATATGASTFTYAVPSGTASPATGTLTYTPNNVAELVQMATTFFGQGSQQGVYVLELGAGSPSTGVATLTTWITNNPSVVYSYLVPRAWDAVAAYLTFLANFEALTAKTYFFTTTTLANYANYTALMKDVVWLIEAPTATPTEFSLASQFWNWLQTNPSAGNQVPPFGFRYVFGVTPYPTVGNQSTRTAINAAGGNLIITGAEGGIVNTLFAWGTTSDDNQMGYWYSVDWVQLNLDNAVSAAVINGSNNPLAPLYYNQAGINQLQTVIDDVITSAVTFGLANGAVVQTQLDPTTFANNFENGVYDGQNVVNAVPFITYLTASPGDYKIGKYAGFQIVYTPQLGFQSILINVLVTELPVQ